MNALVPSDIRHCWETVRPGLESIARRQKTEWRPEDVYAACLHGQAALYLSPDDEGFVVLQKRLCSFSGETALFVWAAWGEGVLRGKYLPALEELARLEGASVLQAHSKRKGLARTGWEPTYTIFQRRL